MYSNRSSIFLLGHTWRFIPGILFLNYNFTRYFHSALQSGCNHIWGINPYPCQHWVVSGFCIFSVWWSWNGVPWLLSSGFYGYELHDAVLLLHIFVFTMSFCLGCFPVSPLSNIYFVFMTQIKNSSETPRAPPSSTRLLLLSHFGSTALIS